MTKVATIDFHVTSDCNQECPYCWGPQGFDEPVDTATARAIVERVRYLGIRRIVFTGGDPLLRPDVGDLIDLAAALGLEVALSTTGDERVTVSQSYKLYHALKDNGVEVKFVVYPVGGHFPGDPVHRRDVRRRWVSWIAEHF